MICTFDGLASNGRISVAEAETLRYVCVLRRDGGVALSTRDRKNVSGIRRPSTGVLRPERSEEVDR